MIDRQSPAETETSIPGRLDRLLRHWNYEGSAFVTAIVFTTIALLCLSRLYVGLSGVTDYSHDCFIFLDGGWRVLHGQRPHTDFFAGFGSLVYLLTALGLQLARGGAEGYGYIQAIFGLLAGTWAYLLAYRRVGQLPAAAFCFIVVLTSVAPSNIGEPAGWFAGGMMYNRLCYALVSLLLVEIMYPGRLRAGSTEFWGGFSTGVATGMLFFLKFSFFVGAVPLLVLLVVCRDQTRQRWFGIGTGFLALVSVLFAYYGGNFAPLLSDLITLIQIGHVSHERQAVQRALQSGLPFLAVALAAGILLWRGGFPGDGRAVVLAGISIFGLGLCFLLTSFQGQSLPLNSVMAFLILQKLVTRPSLSSAPIFMPVLLLGMLVALSQAATDGLGLAVSTLNRSILSSDKHEMYIPFNAPSLAGFRSVETGYVQFVNDALDLLRLHLKSGDSVASLDFSNPFSFALGIPPSATGTTWLQFPNGSNNLRGLSPERVMGSASVVMLPKTFSDTTLERTVGVVYGPYLEEHFRFVDESTQWKLYRRR